MTALSPQEVGKLLIVDCNDEFLSIATTEHQIVGQPLILRCSVDIDNTMGIKHFKWESNNATIRVRNQTKQSNDHYVISQLNTSNDGQVYYCEVNVTDTDILIPHANGRIVLNLTG